LNGLKVVDLTKFVSGPYATMLMADAGATVVKVEPPGGDPARTNPPLFETPAGPVSATFLRMNRGKLSVEIDLKSDEGLDALKCLIEQADVLVENFRVGVLARLGLDEPTLEELNPRLIYASISGFGHSQSAYRDRPAFNLIAEYEAGVYGNDGDVPRPLGPYVGDLFPGVHALSGILMALHERHSTGRGSRVDIAMFDSMLSFNESAGSYGAWLGSDDAADTTKYFCPSGVYPCSDGHVCIDVVTEKQWQTLCALMGARQLLDDSRLASGVERSQNYVEALAPVFLAWLAQYSGEEVVDLLASNGVPSAVVRRPGDALNGDQARNRKMRLEVSVDGGGPGLPVAASPIRVGSYQRPTSARVARAGEHTSSLLGPQAEPVAHNFDGV
jgi:crotonobetainyl-CoA:carnitine CoA-transferase CaiB-like acyl-CoA transferase